MGCWLPVALIKVAGERDEYAVKRPVMSCGTVTFSSMIDISHAWRSSGDSLKGYRSISSVIEL